MPPLGNTTPTVPDTLAALSIYSRTSRNWNQSRTPSRQDLWATSSLSPPSQRNLFQTCFGHPATLSIASKVLFAVSIGYDFRNLTTDFLLHFPFSSPREHVTLALVIRWHIRGSLRQALKSLYRGSFGCPNFSTGWMSLAETSAFSVTHFDGTKSFSSNTWEHAEQVYRPGQVVVRFPSSKWATDFLRGPNSSMSSEWGYSFMGFMAWVSMVKPKHSIRYSANFWNKLKFIHSECVSNCIIMFTGNQTPDLINDKCGVDKWDSQTTSITRKPDELTPRG